MNIVVITGSNIKTGHPHCWQMNLFGAQKKLVIVSIALTQLMSVSILVLGAMPAGVEKSHACFETL